MNNGTSDIKTIKLGFDIRSTIFFKKRLVFGFIAEIGLNPNSKKVFKKKVKSLAMQGTQKQRKNGVEK